MGSARFLELTGHHGNAAAVDLHRQDLAAGIGNGLFDFAAGVRFNEENDAAATARTADLAGKSALFARAIDDAVDSFCGDGG